MSFLCIIALWKHTCGSIKSHVVSKFYFIIVIEESESLPQSWYFKQGKLNIHVQDSYYGTLWYFSSKGVQLPFYAAPSKDDEIKMELEESNGNYIYLFFKN